MSYFLHFAVAFNLKVHSHGTLASADRRFRGSNAKFSLGSTMTALHVCELAISDVIR